MGKHSMKRTTPVKGLVARLRTAKFRTPWLVALVAIIAVVFTAIGALLPSRDSAPNVKFRIETSRVATDKEPPPLIPSGVKSWADVARWADAARTGKGGSVAPKGYGEFLEQITGYSRADIQVFIDNYEKKGVSLVKVLRKGQVITNSGYNRKTGKYQLYYSFRLKADREVLVAPPGYVPLKARRTSLLAPQAAFADGMMTGASKNCGNAVVFGEQVAKPGQNVSVKPKPSPRKCPEVNDVGKPSNPTYVAPKEDIAPPTKGYTPGNAEDVTHDQEQAPKSGPSEHGSPGEGTGGTTNPDGSHQPAPPPSCAPGPSYPGNNTGEEPITN